MLYSKIFEASFDPPRNRTYIRPMDVQFMFYAQGFVLRKCKLKFLENIMIIMQECHVKKWYNV